MSKILNNIPDVRNTALVIDPETDLAKKYLEVAKDIYQLILPITEDTTKMLFSAISIDASLPKRKRVINLTAITDLEAEETTENSNATLSKKGRNKRKATAEASNENDLGKDIPTVSAQTYQNYKSALKWFHLFDCPRMGKVGHDWPHLVDTGKH